MNNKSRWVIELDYLNDDEYDNVALAEQVEQEISGFKGPFQRLEYDNIVCLICEEPTDVLTLKFQIPETVISIERISHIA